MTNRRSSFYPLASRVRVVRCLLYAAGAFVLAAIVVVALGYQLPAGHVASSEACFARPGGDVFAAIADVARYPEWRSGVSRVDVLTTAPPLRWKESGLGGDVITFEVEESTPPARLRTRIADPSLPFGGTWTYDVTPSGCGTHVRITEHGEVYNPVFRVLSRFVFGHTATMDRFLQDLGRRLR